MKNSASGKAIEGALRALMVLVLAFGAGRAMAAPPSNDECSNAIDLVRGQMANASSFEATDSGTTRCAVTDDKDVWFFYRPGADEVVDVSTCGSDFDTTVAVFDGCGGPQIACSDAALDCGDASDAELSGVSLSHTNDYFIRVAGVGSATGNIVLLVTAPTAAPPANDDCANATPVLDNVEALGTNRYATNSGVSQCAGNDPNDVWFNYTAPAMQSVDISLCDSNFDTTVSVFSGCPGGPLICNDQSDLCGNQSYISCFPVTNGSTYLIRVAGWASEEGDIGLLVTPSSCVPPANDDCANAINVVEGVPVTGDARHATDSGAPRCTSNDVRDIWFRYHVDVDKTVTITTCGSNYDTTLSVLDHCGGSVLACNDQGASCANPNASQLDCLPVLGGRDYLIRLSGYDLAEGDYSLLVTPCAPANDTCATALPIADGGTASGSTTLASDEGVLSCVGNDPYDVWYTYTPNATKSVTISLCGSTYDTTLAVYDACGGTRLYCVDDYPFCTYGASQITCQDFTGGQTYLIRIAGYSGHRGNYTLSISDCAPPVNDDCANATPAPENTTIIGTSHGATGTGNSPCSIQDDRDVWYTYTPDADKLVAFSLCGSSFDTTLSVLDGCGGTTLACNDDSAVCGNTTSRIESFAVTGGVSYLVRIAGYVHSRGNFDLSILDVTVPAVLSISPALPGPSNATSLSFDVVFDRTVENFNDAADVVVNETGLTHSGVSISGSGSSYTVTVSGLAGDGRVSLAVNPASDVQTPGGTPLATSPTSADVTVDTVAPGVALDSLAAGTVNSAIAVNVVLDEVSTDFDNTDISSTNATVSGFSGSGTVYSFMLTSVSNGTFSASVQAGKFHDIAGNVNTASNTLSRSFDSTAPGITLSSGAGASVNGAITVSVALSKPSVNFDDTDITPNNAVVSNFSGSGNAYTFTLTPSTAGSFGASVAAGTFSDGLSNLNLASNTLSRVFDDRAPSFTGITATPSSASVGDEITITFGSSEPIAGDPEVTVNGNPALRGAKSAFTYTYVVQESDPLGAATIAVSGLDEAGNVGVASTDAALSIVQQVPLGGGLAGVLLGVAGAVAVRRARKPA